jgi:4-hydroxyacetophenone monooxygenase
MELRGDEGTPFDDDLDTITRHLDDVDVPSLLMSMVHMTGDLSLLDGPWRPRASGIFVRQGGMTSEEQAAVRAAALEVIVAYRAGGYELPSSPDVDAALTMMRAMVAADVGEEYAELVHGELHVDGQDPGEVAMVSVVDDRAELPVIVIGCGESGLLAGIRLLEAGIPFTIVEKNGGVGGTWHENRYPGCRVDIPNHFYSYSFETNDHWTELFSRQPEIKAYLQDVMDRHGVEPFVRWNTEVVRTVWDERDGVWHVEIRSADGSTERLSARAVISAVGQLNRPTIPDLPGAAAFAGPAFHTARWDAAVDLAGKRVAVIGAGATGFQLVPAIAEDAAQVTVYQRTAQWAAPNPAYFARVRPGVRWAIRHLPYYARWYRLLLMWNVTDGARDVGLIDPAWNGGDRSVSALNDAVREVFTKWLTEQVDDPGLLRKVVPDYPPFQKRMLQDDGTWLRSLQRDDVELVREPIDHIEADAVVTADGTRREADVLVYATGFAVSKVLWPMEIVGRDGTALNELWDDRPGAYLGITVPQFPNFFIMYGPGTNPVSGSSVIWMSECQMHYIVGCLDLLAHGHRTIECRPDVYADYHRRTQDELSRMVWTHPAVSSYYKHADGHVYTVLPWRAIDYWWWTRRPDPADFVLT